jgi:hypothetical protein
MAEKRLSFFATEGMLHMLKSCGAIATKPYAQKYVAAS